MGIFRRSRRKVAIFASTAGIALGGFAVGVIPAGIALAHHAEAACVSSYAPYDGNPGSGSWIVNSVGAPPGVVINSVTGLPAGASVTSGLGTLQVEIQYYGTSLSGTAHWSNGFQDPFSATGDCAPTPPQHVQVPICHATGAEGHWTSQTVDDDSILNDQHEELGNGHAVHQGGRDIIPPFTTTDGYNYPGHNWDAAGQAVYNNGCETPPPPDQCPEGSVNGLNPGDVNGDGSVDSGDCDWTPPPPPCDWPQVKENDCGDHQVVVECSSISGTTSFAVTNKPWSYAVWFSESAPAGPADGTPGGLSFVEDQGGGSVTVYAWVAGTENDALAGSGLPTFNAPETYVVDTDCSTPVPPHWDPVCSTITNDGEAVFGIRWIEDGNTVFLAPGESRSVLPSELEFGYVLIVDENGNEAGRWIPVECSDPEPSASYNGAVDCAGLVDGSGTVDRDGLEGNLSVTVNGQPAVVDGDEFTFTDAAQPLNVVVTIGETDVPVQGALVGPPPGSCEEPPTDVCPNIDGVQSSVPDGMVVDGAGNCVTPPEPPVDVCPNLSGDQTVVPSGMVKDGAGNCVAPTPPPPPADVCPNIDGVQSSVPDGMTRDGAGNCVTPTRPPASTLPPTPVGETS